jgi:hypothetical protein
MSGFDSRRYQIFWVVGLERGPLRLVSTIEELLEAGVENWDYGHGDPMRWPCDTLYPQTSSGHLVGIIGSETKAMELLLLLLYDIRTHEKVLFV